VSAASCSGRSLEGVDEQHPEAPDATTRPEGVAQVDPGAARYERPVDRFRQGAVGSVLAAAMYGLADVLEGREKREQPAIVSEAPTRPDDARVRLLLDPEHPERSVAIVRERPVEPPRTR
jgi:hypothetical protein